VVFLNPEGTIVEEFTWCLEIATSNDVEDLAMYKGYLLINGIEIKKVVMIGDSTIIIILRVVHFNLFPPNPYLS
jgi:hypothetical protein